MAFAVRAATRADRSQVEQLIREMIPGCDAASRVTWLYEGNPAGRALTWLAVEDGEVAGVTSYFPFRLWLDGEPILGSLGGDGYVRPKFRRRGLGGLLHDAARRGMSAHGVGCMYGAPGEMNLTPLKHGGSREIGHVARWVRPLRGAALGVHTRPLDRLIRGILRPRFAAYLDPMVSGDQRADEIWRAAAPAIRLGATRDAAFYTWRFIDAPAQQQPAYVIVSHGRPIAMCALQLMNDGKVMRIIDLVTAPGAWHTALAAIAFHASQTEAHTLDIKLMALDGRRRMMWRSGFTERDHKPFLVVIPKTGDRRFLDPTRWFYSGSDADMDSFD